MAALASPPSFNMRNPAVKRILQEVKEMSQEPSTQFVSMPLESDIFEWQFAVHGPKDSEFEGGIYHGRITLPSEYPFKPPSFMLLSPSGRFEVQTKICLSISNHHPEHWQPSWSVRTALVALIAFMPTKPNGAIGSLEYTKKERRALAHKSRANPPKFGSPERQQIIEQIHEAMLKTAPPVPTTPLVEDDPSAPNTESPETNNNNQPAPGPQAQTPSADPASASESQASSSAAEQPLLAGPVQTTSDSVEKREAPTQTDLSLSGSSSPAGSSSTTGPLQRPTAAAAAPAAAQVTRPVQRVPSAVASRVDSETVQERVLSVVAAILVLGILFILGQKIARAYTGVAFTGGESEL